MKKLILISALLLLGSNQVSAAEFEVYKAFDQLLILQNKLDNQTLNSREIRDIRETALSLRAESLKCKSETEQQLESANHKIKALEQIKPEVYIEIYENLKNAREESRQLKMVLSNCSLSAEESEQVIDASNKLLSGNKLKKLYGDYEKILEGTNITIVIIVLLIALVGLAFFLRSKFMAIKINQETFKNTAKSKEKIPINRSSILKFLAESFSKIVGFVAVLTAIIGCCLGIYFIFNNGVIGGLLLIVATPFIVILIYGLLAMNIEIYQHLKSIDNKLD